MKVRGDRAMTEKQAWEQEHPWANRLIRVWDFLQHQMPFGVWLGLGIFIGEMIK